MKEENYYRAEDIFFYPAAPRLIEYVYHKKRTSVRELFMDTELSYSSIVKIRQKLMKHGIINWTPVRGLGGRDNYITLTDKGKKIAAEFIKIKKIMRDIPAKEGTKNDNNKRKRSGVRTERNQKNIRSGKSEHRA